MQPAMSLTEDVLECPDAAFSFAVVSPDDDTFKRDSFSLNSRLRCEFPPGPGSGCANPISASSRAVRLLSKEEAWRSGRISTD